MNESLVLEGIGMIVIGSSLFSKNSGWLEENIQNLNPCIRKITDHEESSRGKLSDVLGHIQHALEETGKNVKNYKYGRLV